MWLEAIILLSGFIYSCIRALSTNINLGTYYICAFKKHWKSTNQRHMVVHCVVFKYHTLKRKKEESLKIIVFSHDTCVAPLILYASSQARLL